MSIGATFVRSCVDSGAQAAFRRANPVWFTEEETPLYAFVSRHVSRHGRLPGLQTLREEGFAMPNAAEPPEFYAERLTTRSITANIQYYHPELLRGMQAGDTEAMLAAISAMQISARQVIVDSGVQTLKELSEAILLRYQEAQRNPHLLGVTLGWDLLDELTDGGQPGDLIVLAGRPNIGKSYLLFHMARKAWLAGKSIFIVSMEMTGDQVANRLMAMQAGVPPQLVRNGRLSFHGHDRIMSTYNGLDDMPPVHIMTGNFKKTTQDINRVMQEVEADSAYCDAGYLVKMPNMGEGNRREKIAEVFAELKGVAVDRHTPFSTSVQYSRRVKNNQRETPDLADIGETDVIAQIATVGLGIRSGQAPYEETRRIVDMIKNREGRKRSFEIEFEHNPPSFEYLRRINVREDGEEGDDGDGPTREYDDGGQLSAQEERSF